MNNLLLIGLIKKFKAYDMSVFALIYEDFRKLILFYSGRLEDEDAYQDMNVFFVELLYSINLSLFKVDESDCLHRYIAVCIRNRYLYLLRKKRKYEKLNRELFESSLLYDNLPEENLYITQALETLSEKQRLAIIYKYIYNYSDVEISQYLDITRQAVNRLQNRGLKTLKKYYENEKII